nr:AMP-binding protein [Halomarina salina]
MDVLGDLVARSRRSDDPALLAPAVGRTYDYRRFCTTAWKVGHFLRHLGVRTGRSVALVGDDRPEVVLSLYGAALLGATVSFDPPTEEVVDSRVLLAPSDRVDAFDVEPGTQRVAYGDAPSDPGVAYFERDVWSENPTEPPDRVSPDDVLLHDLDGESYTHAAVLDAARRVVEEWGLEPGDRVAVRAPLARPGAVVAGLVAPVLAGGAILLPDGDAVGDLAVGGGEAPESGVLDPATVLE